MRSFRYALVLALAGGAIALGSAAGAADPTGTVNISDAASQQLTGVTLSPGRVTWIDDHPQYVPIYKRGAQLDSSSIILAPTSQLGLTKPKGNGRCCGDTSFGEGYPFSASGVRTGWTTETHVTYYSNGSTISTVTTGGRLSTGTTVTQTFKAPSVILRVSGTRVLYRNNGGFRLFDLRTKISTDLTATYGGAAQKVLAADLWGNSLYVARADGSIWRKDLGATSHAVRLVAGPASFSIYDPVQLFAWGDYLGWVRGSGASLDCGMRKNTSGSPTVELPICTTGLTSAGAIGQDADTKIWSLQRYNGTNVDLPVPTTATQVTIDGGRLAWIQADGVGKIAPLPSAPDTQPRYLGNAIAPTTYKTGWTLDLVASEALADCTVLIKKVNGPTVRTLPCSAGLMPAGEVQAHWDGKNTQGTKVPSGGYKWFVLAADADLQSLQRADGLEGEITGPINVQ